MILATFDGLIGYLRLWHKVVITRVQFLKDSTLFHSKNFELLGLDSNQNEQRTRARFDSSLSNIELVTTLVSRIFQAMKTEKPRKEREIFIAFLKVFKHNINQFQTFLVTDPFIEYNFQKL